MKDGVILRVSKPARMGIDDSGLNALRPPIQHKLLPIEGGEELPQRRALVGSGETSI